MFSQNSEGAVITMPATLQDNYFLTEIVEGRTPFRKSNRIETEPDSLTT
jgi:hypothetical protein